MAREKILVVDDEEDILDLVKINLSQEGYAVECATTGEQALDKLTMGPVDLIVLDIMLPGIDGYTVARRIKSDPDFRNIPIVMLTAKGSEADVVTGLELGADDYITKPFSPKILLARIKAVLRRSATGQAPGVLQVDDLELHPGSRQLLRDGERIDLTSTEFSLAQILLQKRNHRLTDGVSVGIPRRRKGVIECPVEWVLVGSPQIVLRNDCARAACFRYRFEPPGR